MIANPRSPGNKRVESEVRACQALCVERVGEKCPSFTAAFCLSHKRTSRE